MEEEFYDEPETIKGLGPTEEEKAAAKAEKKALWKRRKYFASTIVGAVFSIGIGLALALFDFVMGCINQSVWYFALCIYLIFLSVIRMIIVASQFKKKNRKEDEGAKRRKEIYKGTYILLFALTCVLAWPVIIMIMGQRSYTANLVICILQSIYTVYRVITSISHFVKSRNEKNILVHELRTINLVDCMVSVMSLQAAFIMAAIGNQDNPTMCRITGYIAAGILLATFITEFVAFFRHIKDKK